MMDQASANPYIHKNDMPVQQDIRQSFTAEVNPLILKQKSCHCQAFVGTLILLFGLALTIVLYFQNVNNMQRQIGVGGFVGILVGIYILYLMVVLICNKLQSYLNNMEAGDKFHQYYDFVTSIQGVFRFTAECYHYETRHHTRYVKDSNGNQRIQHYTTTQKVVTHRATEYLHVKQTIDDSGNVDSIRAMTNIIFIHYLVEYRFFDDANRNYFDSWYSQFQRRHHFDSHQNYSYFYEMPQQFKPRKAFFVGQLKCPLSGFFYLSAIFGLVWPYSLWVESLITRFDIKIMKILKFI